MALLLAARHILSPKRRLPITGLKPLFKSLPADFELIVADVGSIGGLHARWRPLQRHLVTLNFDPLDSERGDERSRFFPVLIGAADGTAVLNITRRGSMSSTLVPNGAFYDPFWDKPEHVEIVETLSAPVTTLDSIAERESLWADALKIDVQGGEAKILDGAQQLLSRSVLLAEIECSFVERYKGQETFDQIVQRMRSHGFALLDVRRLKRYRYRNKYQVRDASLGRGARAGRLAFCDAIFVVEPQLLWDRIDRSADPATIGLKAVALMLVYGKGDLAAATFERVRDRLAPEIRDPLEAFFASMADNGDWRQQLHLDFDAWSQRV